VKIHQIHSWLYLLNATILLTHQIDAAYWHEWELFRMPGGLQLFLILNLPIMFLFLYGQQAVALQRKSGIAISWLVVACGFFAIGIHSFFLSQGDEAFRLPVSLGILVATFLLSLAQAIALVILQRTIQRAGSLDRNRGQSIASPK
jgi:hypothetical protein